MCSPIAAPDLADFTSMPRASALIRVLYISARLSLTQQSDGREQHVAETPEVPLLLDWILGIKAFGRFDR